MAIRILTLNNPSHDVKYAVAIESIAQQLTSTNSAPYLYSHNKSFFEQNLSGSAINIIALHGDKLVGYSALRKMLPWPKYLDNYQHAPEKCALMLINIVSPDYQGKGIGKKLSDKRISIAQQTGFTHLYATVHPDNLSSITILKKAGFEEVAQKLLFTEKLMRKIMCLNING